MRKERDKKIIIILSVLLVIVILVNGALILYQLRVKNATQKEAKKIETQENREPQDSNDKKEEASTAQEKETSTAREEGTTIEVKIDDEEDEVTESSKEGSPDEETKSIDGMGVSEPIPEDVRESMKGISMPEDATVGFDDLAYLTIPHYDFNGNIVEGHMVVDKDVAEDVLHIFKELYDIKYPIERMELIDKYDEMQTEEFDSLDRSSMGRNNTSCFCYRVVNGSSNLSNHARGRAIDLNPLINPWVQGSSYSPRNAGPYVDREKTFEDDVINRATIHENDEVVQIFEKYGWSWGGYWQSQQDYQHFEKE